MFYYNLLSMLL